MSGERGTHVGPDKGPPRFGQGTWEMCAYRTYPVPRHVGQRETSRRTDKLDEGGALRAPAVRLAARCRLGETFALPESLSVPGVPEKAYTESTLRTVERGAL
jgi:hypothetical protein